MELNGHLKPVEEFKDKVVEVKTNDGRYYHGKIVNEDFEFIVLKDRVFGNMAIGKQNIVYIRIIDEKSLRFRLMQEKKELIKSDLYGEKRINGNN